MNYPPNKTAELCFENPNIFSIYFDPNTTQAFIIAISAAPAITTNTKDGLQQSMYISRKTVLSLEEKQICIFYWWSYTGWNKKKVQFIWRLCIWNSISYTTSTSATGLERRILFVRTRMHYTLHTYPSRCRWYIWYPLY